VIIKNQKKKISPAKEIKKHLNEIFTSGHKPKIFMVVRQQNAALN